jgi:outer membrane receptor protein involved in Fe transport
MTTRQTQNYRSGHLLRSAVAACMLMSTPYAFGQSVGATLRGQVTAASAPAAGATVTATNTQTGLTRTVQSGQGGNYSVAGLPPGSYKVDVNAAGETSSQVVTLQVGQTATLDLGVGKTTNVESITVTAERLVETKTSEVSSYVSLKQIEMLPQNSRNFLQFADTVPGVQFKTAGDGSTELRSGAQASNGVNVFIDGVGQKNYVLRGGVSGQTSSRGNPFPQLAIGEYKVITSNYKAEFDQLSSAAVVAATRSGTNEFEAEGFWDRTDESWRAADPIEARVGQKANSEQSQYGAAFGGPIIKDKLHFFLTYEGKKVETPKTISLGEGVPTLGQYDSLLGVNSAPFNEDLFFGKLSWIASEAQLVEFTAKMRDESEVTSIGDRNTATYGTSKDNEELRLDLRHQYTAASFLNDVHLTYEDATFNPRPVTNTPGYQFTTGAADRAVLNVGGGQDYQKKGQKGFGLQDDLTFNAFDWLGSHTVKTGVKYKSITINSFEQQPYNPQFSFDVDNSFTIPYKVRFGSPLAGLDRDVESKNKQFGIYLQDDWEVTSRLLLNLGIRWDYEETPSYLDYVTPTDVVAGINALDTRPGAPAGQTYAQALARGGININDYISTGNNRDAFMSAIQPRVGFSFDLDDDQRHVIFGGAGRAYDRNVFDYLALERSKGTFPAYERSFAAPGRPCAPGDVNCLAWDPAYLNPAALAALVAANPSTGREVDLINNNLRTPYSDQFSLGMRNRVEFLDHDWLTSAAVAYIESNDGIVFLLGNRRVDGSFRDIPGTIWGGSPFGQGIPGLGDLIIAKNGLKTRATQLLLQAQKPYSEASPWSMTLAYTFTQGKENRANVGKSDEHYLFDYPDVAGYGWQNSTGVERHRFVGTGIVDVPWGLTLSAKLTLASPSEYEAVNCYNVTAQPVDRNCYFQNFKADTTLGFKEFDMALKKDFDIGGDVSLSVRADILNIFNWDNVDTYEVSRGVPGAPNSTYGDPTAYLQPTRTFKLALSAKWR